MDRGGGGDDRTDEGERQRIRKSMHMRKPLEECHNIKKMVRWNWKN